MPVIAPVVNRRTGKASGSRFNATLEGGPELAAKLNAMDIKIRKTVAAQALLAAGHVIAAEWASRAPVGTEPHDPHPGAYRQSLEQEDTVRAKGSKWGALGSVSPGLVSGIDEGDQPRVYAAKLEFADGEPSARPAFDASRQAATEALQAELVKVLK